ncbi:MAG: M48 family metallopeptidase [Anaerolineae bacterium]|nr:M48 family metallopeptidase [Anaerolineae bacterium]
MPSKYYRWLLLSLALIILLSPLLYWSTGIGQAAAGLSAEISRLPDGTLLSSPKAEALHSLSLPMRLQRMLLYPLLLLAFQFSGGAVALRRWLEGKIAGGQGGRGAGEIKTAEGQRSRGAGVKILLRSSAPLLLCLCFVVLFNLALSLLYLPFNFYRSFTVGHQFGLSTLIALGWFGDWAKSLLINLSLDGLTWTGLYGLMRWLPRRWPLPAGVALVLFTGVMVLLEPVLITPLFYQVRPLEDAQLRARILALADRAHMQVDSVEVIDASAKTTTVNAYFTGFGGAQRIVLYDTLLRDYTPDQIEVVLAHEMGHWYYQHVLLSIVGIGAAGWLGLFALQWLLHRTWRWLGLNGPADIAGLPFVLAVFTLVSYLALPFETGISRFAERQADHFALATSQKPQAVIELFEQFAVQNLSLVEPPAWEKVIFYTHPSLAERIRMAEGWQSASQ